MPSKDSDPLRRVIDADLQQALVHWQTSIGRDAYQRVIHKITVDALLELIDRRRAHETVENPAAWCVEASHDGSLSPPTALRMDAFTHLHNMRELHPGITWTLVPLYRRAVKASADETKAESTETRLLGDMLAVIHGDGGHYQAEHGTSKAVADAIAKYYATRFDALCPHGMPLAENICGPCSQGRPNRPAVKTSDESKL